MRDFSCFGDAAVTTLAAGAAAGVGGGGGGGGGATAALDRSLQAATASVYRVALSSRKELRIKVTWTRAVAAVAGGPTGIALDIDDGSLAPPVASAALIGTPRRTAPAPVSASPAPAAQKFLLQKKRGTRSFVTDAGTAVSVYWDTAEAKYHPAGAAEPSRDYHLAVVADGELALLLGGNGGGSGEAAARDFRRRFAPAPRRALLSRQEQVRGPFSSFSSHPTDPPPCAVPVPAAGAPQLVHTTRCRFRDDGAEHEVTVACRGEEWGSRDGEVSVSVDGKKVVEARRVKWNFRGNRTAVLGDGAVVEVMWDVHDWWFAAGSSGGCAQFMVKARGAADGGRVWMDEEMASKGHPPAGFFLHLQCYRR